MPRPVVLGGIHVPWLGDVKLPVVPGLLDEWSISCGEAWRGENSGHRGRFLRCCPIDAPQFCGVSQEKSPNRSIYIVCNTLHILMFDWDEHNERKVRKHGITPADA